MSATSGLNSSSPSCAVTTDPAGVLRRVGDEWAVNWVGNSYSFKPDDGGFIYLGVFTSKDGGYNGYAQFNPDTGEIFATEGYTRGTARLSGARPMPSSHTHEPPCSSP